jgi:pimeloyl-ACP methyl ester carboxylesterase
MLDSSERQIRTIDLDIHVQEVGAGPPLVWLHAGLLSNDPIWNGHPGSALTYLEALSARFRVILPETRGHGRTPNPGGEPVSYRTLARDLMALCDGLELQRPLLGGFSDGGMIATVAAIEYPDRVGGVVNAAGYDLLNPSAPTQKIARQVFGGAPNATKADPAAAEKFYGAKDPDFLRRLTAGHASGWKQTIESAFDRFTSPSGYSFDDLKKVVAPSLILTGDRDFFCSVEEAVVAFRRLKDGELAILPGLGHQLSRSAVDLAIEFLTRRGAGGG